MSQGLGSYHDPGQRHSGMTAAAHAQNYFHILNPSERHRAEVQRFFEKHPQLQHMWVERTSHPTHLETIVEWALNEGRREIAVWGGDGTLSRVVQAIYQLRAFEQMTVALVPTGTCDDFARALALPSWKIGVQLATEKKAASHPYDVGLLSSSLGKRVFINNAGFGRTAAASAGHRRSSPIKDIFSFTPKNLDLGWELNGVEHYETRRAILGVVCNGPFFNRAMHFAKDVKPDDATLNAFVEDPQSKIGLLAKFLKCRLGLPLADHHTFRINAHSLRIESDSDLFPQTDGEPVGKSPVRRLEYSVLPDKLRIAVWR